MNQTDSYTRSIHRTGRAGSLLAILWMLGIPAVMCGILVKLEYVGICRSDIIIEKSEQGLVVLVHFLWPSQNFKSLKALVQTTDYLRSIYPLCEAPAGPPLRSPAGEGFSGDTQHFPSFGGGDRSIPPVLRQLLKALRHGNAVGTEADPAFQRSRNALRLTLMNKFPLRLSHIAEQLEDNMRN